MLTTVTSHIWGEKIRDWMILNFQKKKSVVLVSVGNRKVVLCCWIALPFLEAANSAHLMSQEGNAGSCKIIQTTKRVGNG